MLARQVEAADPRIRAAFIEVNVEPGRSATIWVEPRLDAAGTPVAVGYDQLFVEPSSGRILGRRDYGSCCFQRERLIPFLYELHRRLTLPGHWGDWLMGGVAVLWLLDSFVALVLTLPRRRPILARWKAAWRIKTGAARFRVLFDLHRAGGLWAWIVLLAVAMSSVYLNLGQEVFRPIVGLFSPLAPSPYEDRPTAGGGTAELRSFDEAMALAASFAAERGWSKTVSGLYYDQEAGLYIVDFGRLDDSPLGMPWAAFDACTGEAIAVYAPDEGSPGDRFLLLQFPLHSGHILGLSGRILICLGGIAVALLSVTGVLIWYRKP